MRHLAYILIGLAALLASESLLAAKKTFRIQIACDSDGQLQAIVMPDGRSELRGSDTIEEFVRRVLPDRSARIVIAANTDTPYRCIGGFIFYSQQLGYKRISFIAEPPLQ